MYAIKKLKQVFVKSLNGVTAALANESEKQLKMKIKNCFLFEAFEER